jgi:hypothetical protein
VKSKVRRTHDTSVLGFVGAALRRDTCLLHTSSSRASHWGCLQAGAGISAIQQPYSSDDTGIPHVLYAQGVQATGCQATNTSCNSGAAAVLAFSARACMHPFDQHVYASHL